MSKYFRYFPKTEYKNTDVVDITRRVKVLFEELGQDPHAFLSYTVKDEDRPEDIAHYYYGDVGLVWMVYLANDIVDPYSQWVLSNVDFEKMLINKYKDESGAVGHGVIAWTQNQTITENIAYYKNKENPTIKVTKDTATNDPSFVAGEWDAVRYYEYEMELNENKRQIYLVSDIYADQMVRDLRKLMNE